MNAVGRLICQKVKDRGISLRSIASSLTPPVSEQFIQNIKNGRTPIPHARVKDFSRVVGCSEEELAEAMICDYGTRLWDEIDSKGAVSP